MSRKARRLANQSPSPDYLEAQDCVLIVTDHSNIDYQYVVKNSRLIVDTRNATAGTG